VVKHYRTTKSLCVFFELLLDVIGLIQSTIQIN